MEGDFNKQRKRALSNADNDSYRNKVKQRTIPKIEHRISRARNTHAHIKKI